MINIIKLPITSIRLVGVEIISLFVPLFREIFLLGSYTPLLMNNIYIFTCLLNEFFPIKIIISYPNTTEGGVLVQVIKHTLFFDHSFLGPPPLPSPLSHFLLLSKLNLTPLPSDEVGRMILDISKRPIILRHEFSDNSTKKMDPLVRGVLERGGLGVLVLGLLRDKSDHGKFLGKREEGTLYLVTYTSFSLFLTQHL